MLTAALRQDAVKKSCLHVFAQWALALCGQPVSRCGISQPPLTENRVRGTGLDSLPTPPHRHCGLPPGDPDGVEIVLEPNSLPAVVPSPRRSWPLGPITTAVLDDTVGNLIQLVDRAGPPRAESEETERASSFDVWIVSAAEDRATSVRVCRSYPGSNTMTVWITRPTSAPMTVPLMRMY